MFTCPPWIDLSGGLKKKMKRNEGKIPQYYVEGDHEAINEHEVCGFAQAEMERYMGGNGRYSGVSIFLSKIRCGECGCWFGQST